MVSEIEKAIQNVERRKVILSNAPYVPTLEAALRAVAQLQGTSPTAMLNNIAAGGAVNFAQQKKGRRIIGSSLHDRYRNLICYSKDECEAFDAKFTIYQEERTARGDVDFLKKPQALLERLFPKIDLSLAEKDPEIAAKLFNSIDILRQSSVDELLPLQAALAAINFMKSISGFNNIRERQFLSLYGTQIALRIVRDLESYRHWVNVRKDIVASLDETPETLQVYSRLDDVRLAALEQVGTIEAGKGKEFWGAQNIRDEVRKIRKLAQAADAKPDIFRDLSGGGVAATTLDYVLADIESLNPERRAEALSLLHEALEADLQAFETNEWAQIDLERIIEIHLEQFQLELAEQALRQHLQLEDASSLKSPKRKANRDRLFADFYGKKAERSSGEKRKKYLEMALKYKGRG